MNLLEPAPPPWPSRMLGLLRIVAGFMFLTAGTMKVFGFPPGAPGMPPFTFLSQMGIGGVLETVGGTAILIGLFTRPVAFVLAGEMAVAYFQFHFPNSFWPTVNNGVPAALYCFVFLYLAAAGPGAFSVDGALKRR